MDYFEWTESGMEITPSGGWLKREDYEAQKPCPTKAKLLALEVDKGDFDAKPVDYVLKGMATKRDL